jgi:hypothetical protein
MTIPLVYARARARRVLTGLAPIYAALLLLVGLSLAGFAASFWPQAPGPSASRESRDEIPRATLSFDRGPDAPAQPSEPRVRRRWM